MSSDYYENLEGSPYINEAAMDYINKLKNAGSNFINKFKGSKPYSQNNPNPKPTQELSSTDKDFIKIVEKVSEMLIAKIKTDLKTNHNSEYKEKYPNEKSDDPEQINNIDNFVNNKNKPGYNQLKNKEIEADRDRLMGNFGESINEEDESQDKGFRSTTLAVSDNEEDAGGWLNWFRGQKRKSNQFGLDLGVEDTVKLHDGKLKDLKLKWSNNNHKNKIIVIWNNNNFYRKDAEKDLQSFHRANKEKERAVNTNASMGSAELEENIESSKNPGEFIIFEFYDDQINPKSPSYQEPSIALLLTQANRYSKIVDRIKTSPELKKLSAPLFEWLYEVVKQKWTEFKGHDINPETLKFKLNKHGNILYVDINGETESLTPIMINSILEGGENTKDVNFNNTGLSFNVFISKLKDAGFPSEKLSVDAKKVYDGEKTIDNPVDNKIPPADKSTPSIDKSKMAAWKYTIDNGMIIGPDPSKVGNKKSSIGEWSIEDTKSIPSDVIKIIHSDPEKSSEMKSEIERINNLKLQKEIPPSNDFSPEIEPTTGFSPFPEKKKNNIKKENIKEQYSLMNLLNRSN